MDLRESYIGAVYMRRQAWRWLIAVAVTAFIVGFATGRLG